MIEKPIVLILGAGASWDYGFPTGPKLKAKIYGEKIRPELGGTVVKAVTLYKYKFEKNKKGYKVRVSLDI